MEDRLMRTRLLLGDENVARLRRCRVLVVGCGAVGSFAIEALARGGIGHLKLVDFDCVELSNINRQLFALTSTLGQKKVAVAQARVKDISSDILVETSDVFLNQDNADEIIRDVDFVIDAIDSMDGKIALIQTCLAKEIPFISSMGAARRLDPAQIKIAPMHATSVCPLAAALRQKLRKQKISLDFPCVFSTEPAVGTLAPAREMGSLVTITGIFGLMMAHYALTFLLK